MYWPARALPLALLVPLTAAFPLIANRAFAQEKLPFWLGTFSIDPADESGFVDVSFGGTWRDSCVPGGLQYRTQTGRVDFDLFHAGIDTQCLQRITPWSVETTIAFDQSGEYDLFASLWEVSLRHPQVRVLESGPDLVATAYLVPTLLGDLNDDGTRDAVDIDLLSLSLRTGQVSPMFDLNDDDRIDTNDRYYLLENLLRTGPGDANLDRRFDADDLLEVFQAGEYEDSLLENSRWKTGDWTGDAEFDSADLIEAFQRNCYEGTVGTCLVLPVRPASIQGGGVAAVPEPKSRVLVLAAVSLLTMWRRRV